ncbi:hypothetical protein [Persicobacter psychrovividus]|uniref:hypothetical protein n=1 Tax=Persicobacter psychrovividus TaxID=387638 RepID=UPI0030CA33EF
MNLTSVISVSDTDTLIDFLKQQFELCVQTDQVCLEEHSLDFFQNDQQIIGHTKADSYHWIDFLDSNEAISKAFDAGYSIEWHDSICDIEGVSNSIFLSLTPLKDYQQVWQQDQQDGHAFFKYFGISFEEFATFTMGKLEDALPHMSRMDMLNFLDYIAPTQIWHDYMVYLTSPVGKKPFSKEEAALQLKAFFLANQR